MKKLISSLLLFSVAFAYTPYIEIGMGLGKYTSDYFDTNYKFGSYEVGVGVKKNYDNYEIEANIKYAYTNSDVNGEEKGFHYLKSNLNLDYKVYKNENINVYVLGGGYLEYMLDGNEYSNDFGFGLSLGAKVEYDRYFIEGRFDYGLKDLDKSEDKVKDRVVMLDLGVYF